MLDSSDVYSIVRTEIIANHSLMHWHSLIVAIVILVGVQVIEARQTILSVFLPLLSIAWAAAMVRFDFFIHRQAAYLRYLESQTTGGNSFQLWETWKTSLGGARFVIPPADFFAVIVIVVPTLYLLFGPSRQFFQIKQWKGGNLYAWSTTALLCLLLASLLIIPTVANW